MSDNIGHFSLKESLAEGMDVLDQALPESLKTSVLKNLQSREPDFWEIANQLGHFYNEKNPPEKVVEECKNMIEEIRYFQGKRAVQNQNPTTVVFGTSGWRGVIGEDFTLLNVHKVVRGIIEMMKTGEFLHTIGFDSFDQVKDAGILVLRDNRFMGEDFMEASMKELALEGIKIYRAGECPTGVGSALLTLLKAAGSINFTPSHNPMEYAGIKFNPADGGPADKNLTTLIEHRSNALMKTDTVFQAAETSYEPFVTNVEAAHLFERFIREKSVVFDLDLIRSWMEENKQDLYLVIDFMHGSSRGYIEKLLGDDLVRSLTDSDSILFLNTNDDYSFHGVKPEPNSKNQEVLISYLKTHRRRFTLAVALDPDADRIRYADADMDIDMNRFGAIAYAHLLDKGHQGAICSTVPSSDFALEIARQNGFEVIETPVGFKHFRSALSSGRVLMAFEESDGISVRGHTLEKCALAGFLLALDALMGQEKPLSQQFLELQARYGYYYPAKSGAEVKGISVDAWQLYKSEVLDVLQKHMFKVGDTIEIGDSEKKIREVNTSDGIKLTFNDKSWILLRPSGTEPKFRYYYERVSEEPLPDIEKRMKEYENAASEILEEARKRADN